MLAFVPLKQCIIISVLVKVYTGGTWGKTGNFLLNYMYACLVF